MASRLESLQAVATVTGVAALVLGFLASLGLRLVPVLSAAAFWPLAFVLGACGAAGGVATVLRGRTIDRRRWEAVDDPLLTSGEREYAHKEAERQRRWAGTVFFAAPVALSYWTAYQLPVEAGPATTPLLALFPLAGYLIGLLAAHWRGQRRSPE